MERDEIGFARDCLWKRFHSQIRARDLVARSGKPSSRRCQSEGLMTKVVGGNEKNSHVDFSLTKPDLNLPIGRIGMQRERICPATARI